MGAFYRGWAAFSFLIYLSVLLLLSDNFFVYLTNWGNLLLCLNFSALSFSHLLACHYCCRTNSPKRQPWWRISVFLYELTLVLAVVITIGFWTVVLPFEASDHVWLPPLENYGPEQSKQVIINWTSRKEINRRNLPLICIAHILPQLVQIVDFCFVSAIKINPKHLPGILVCSLLYFAVYMYQTFWVFGRNQPPIYPSHDWYNYPKRAVVLTIIIFGTLVSVFMLLVRYSRWRVQTVFIKPSEITMATAEIV